MSAAPDRMPFPFGVNEFTTLPWSFEEDVARYAELGADAIEVCEQKLDDRRYREQLAQARGRGLARSRRAASPAGQHQLVNGGPTSGAAWRVNPA